MLHTMEYLRLSDEETADAMLRFEERLMQCSGQHVEFFVVDELRNRAHI